MNNRLSNQRFCLFNLLNPEFYAELASFLVLSGCGYVIKPRAVYKSVGKIACDFIHGLMHGIYSGVRSRLSHIHSYKRFLLCSSGKRSAQAIVTPPNWGEITRREALQVARCEAIAQQLLNPIQQFLKRLTSFGKSSASSVYPYCMRWRLPSYLHSSLSVQGNN